MHFTIISSKLVNELGELIKYKKPDDFLFCTRDNKNYSTRTVPFIFQKALQKSGVKKKASCHTLRHSFATHLLEKSIDIRKIKSLLGHRSIRTTILYLHLTDFDKEKVESPL